MENGNKSGRPITPDIVKVRARAIPSVHTRGMVRNMPAIYLHACITRVWLFRRVATRPLREECIYHLCHVIASLDEVTRTGGILAPTRAEVSSYHSDICSPDSPLSLSTLRRVLYQDLGCPTLCCRWACHLALHMPPCCGFAVLNMPATFLFPSIFCVLQRDR